MRRIGGTDIARIVGLSSYGGPIDAYRRIVEGHSPEQTPAMRRGTLLEPVIRQMYVDETGAQLRTPHPGVVVSPRHEFMCASVDDLATLQGEQRVAEYKSANLRAAQQFGEPGTDAVPQGYLVQCAWYLATCDLSAADLAVLVAGDDFRIYRIQRDLELEAMLLEAGARFWRDNILPRRPPPPDASEAYAEWLSERYPQSRGPMLSADAEAERWAQQLRQAKADIDDAEWREKEARNALVSIIGDADGVAGNGWQVTYRSTKGREQTDWKAVCEELQISKAVIERFSKRTPYRVLRCRWGDE